MVVARGGRTITATTKAAAAHATLPRMGVRGVTVEYPGVRALDNVTVDFMAGEIHAIVGENGAGKSTLMKTLYGMHQPDDGTITVNGHAVQFKTPTEAIVAGIGMVHQHFKLADNLTIIENIIL